MSSSASSSPPGSPLMMATPVRSTTYLYSLPTASEYLANMRLVRPSQRDCPTCGHPLDHFDGVNESALLDPQSEYATHLPCCNTDVGVNCIQTWVECHYDHERVKCPFCPRFICRPSLPVPARQLPAVNNFMPRQESVEGRRAPCNTRENSPNPSLIAYNHQGEGEIVGYNSDGDAVYYSPDAMFEQTSRHLNGLLLDRFYGRHPQFNPVTGPWLIFNLLCRIDQRASKKRKYCELDTMDSDVDFDVDQFERDSGFAFMEERRNRFERSPARHHRR